MSDCEEEYPAYFKYGDLEIEEKIKDTWVGDGIWNIRKVRKIVRKKSWVHCAVYYLPIIEQIVSASSQLLMSYFQLK